MKNLLLLMLLVFSSFLVAQSTYSCATPAHVAPIPAFQDADPLDGDYCVTAYIEVDHDIVLDKGVNVKPFIEGMLAEVSNIYEADGISVNWEVAYWNEPSPYSAASSGQMLTAFREYRTANGGHPGDVAMLLSYQASGGIAYVDVMCREKFGYSFSAIRSTYKPYPEYSWSVEVIAHELGHNLGSPHTQSCSWPGGAIDSCYPVEGNCDTPGYPADGGTIMSYCHLRPEVGIDFTLGFGPLPTALMKNRIADAACAECTEEPYEPEVDTCADQRLLVEVLLDNYPRETTWEVWDESGVVVARSGTYAKSRMNEYVADTLCLPAGCYAFVIEDEDGLAGYGCGEGLYIVSTETGEVASGQNWTGQQLTRFCMGQAAPCSSVSLNVEDLVPYTNQDRHGSSVDLDENGVTLEGNSWKGLRIDQRITASTVLRAQVRVNAPGEIHALGVSHNVKAIYPSQSFRFAGSQAWGIESADIPLGEWADIKILIGTILEPGQYEYLVLINDYDAPGGSASTSFRNVEFCEGRE